MNNVDFLTISTDKKQHIIFLVYRFLEGERIEKVMNDDVIPTTIFLT